MEVYYCSVGHKPADGQGQLIEPGDWRIVRLPYEAGQEYRDRQDMHDRRHPDAYVVQDWTADDRSGLIWPYRDGLGCIETNIHWEAGGYQELRDQFVRDPLGPAPDTTATDHRTPTKGIQCFTKQHWLEVGRRVPLAVRVAHDDTLPRRLVMVQFKLTIFSNTP